MKKNIEINITKSTIIMDPECGNDLEKKNFTLTEILIGFVIPFVFFWGGMLSTFFWNSVLVWILSLVPFYGFMFFCTLVTGKKYANAFIGSSLLNFLTSLVLAILLFFVPEDWAGIGKVCRLSLLNLAPAFFGMFFCATNGFVESIKGTPVPIFPFFMNGDS